MGLGLIQLAATGKENYYINENPEITYFKIAFKRYSNYSIEQTPQYFKSSPDFGRKCSVIVNKNADMLGMGYICITLPSISSNYLFKWNNKIGLLLINYVELEIDGIKVDRQYGEWINIWKELTNKFELSDAYNKMIGNISILTDYSKIKKSYILYVPLSFWFCLDNSLALPIISLKTSEIKLTVEFNDVDKCYTLSPQKYIKISNNICIYENNENLIQNISSNNKVVGKFIEYDVINQYVYYDTYISNFNINIPIIGETSNDTVIPISLPYNVNHTFVEPSIITAYIILDYIFLDSDERSLFYNKNYESLITTTQVVNDLTVYSQNIFYKLQLHNLIRLIVWRILPIYNQNDVFNYTYNGEELLTKMSLVINSVNTSDIFYPSIYKTIQSYQQNYTNNEGIYSYSYALYATNSQPSGALNFSVINDTYINMTLNKLINYQFPVNIKAYAQQYNIIQINNGIFNILFK